MNVLLINHYAGSDRLGMEYRPFYLAREWVAAGHRVTIVGADYSHLRGSQPPVASDLGVTNEEGVRYRWIRTSRYQGNGAARIANMVTFVAKLLRYARRLAREEMPDIIICSSTYPLDIYPGALIARISGAALVFEVHDLWPLTPMMIGGFSARHPYIRLLQHAEDFACARADLVASILPDARDYLISRGLAQGKFLHIPNGIPLAHLRSAPTLPLTETVARVIAQEREQDRFLIGYAGGLSLTMDVGLLFDVAAMPASSSVAFLIAGDGPEGSDLRARVRDNHLDNIHMVGRLPKSHVPAFLATMDALAIPWHSSPLYRHGVSPNKVFDYMFAGRPILQASDASNDLVSDANCGFTVRPGDPAAFAAAIARLRALPPDMQRRLGMNGQRFVEQRHDFHVLAETFLASMQRVVDTRASQERLAGRSARPRRQPI